MAISRKGKNHFQRHSSRQAGGSDEKLRLYGVHTVAAALANPDRQISRIWLTENASRRLSEDGVVIPMAPEIVTTRAIGKLVPGDAVHQGAVVEAAPLPQVAKMQLETMRLLVVLDQITDPHNVGAIMRSAVAFGADAMVTTRRHSPVESAVLAKSASGALDMIGHLTVTNLSRHLAELADLGFTCLGLDSAGDIELANVHMGGKIALVLGAEGRGLRQGTRAACAQLARLDLPGSIKSLNVSNAAAVSLYLVTAGKKSLPSR